MASGVNVGGSVAVAANVSVNVKVVVGFDVSAGSGKDGIVCIVVAGEQADMVKTSAPKRKINLFIRTPFFYRRT